MPAEPFTGGGSCWWQRADQPEGDRCSAQGIWCCSSFTGKDSAHTVRGSWWQGKLGVSFLLWYTAVACTACVELTLVQPMPVQESELQMHHTGCLLLLLLLSCRAA